MSLPIAGLAAVAVILTASVFVAHWSDTSPGSVETDWVALEALYDATDGESWDSGGHWLSHRPMGEWQ